MNDVSDEFEVLKHLAWFGDEIPDSGLTWTMRVEEARKPRPPCDYCEEESEYYLPHPIFEHMEFLCESCYGAVHA